MMLISQYRKLFFLFLIIALSFSSKAQQTHFVYLQTDNGQPFYVKMNNKVISSSAEGYVILPGISDGDYQIAIGFPKKEHPEESFNLSVDNNEGYLIKNFEDKGLQLFNLETLALINGIKGLDKPMATNTTKEPDRFSQMLANVVKDSSILDNHQVKTSAQEKLPVVDSQSIPDNVVSVAVSDANTFAEVKNDSSVSKLLSRQNKEGLQMVYESLNNHQPDTVSVFMPSQNEPKTTNENNTVTEIKNPPVSSFTDSVKFNITSSVVKIENDTSGYVHNNDSRIKKKKSDTSPVQVFIIDSSKEVVNQSNKEEFAKEGQPNLTEKKNDKSAGGEIILLPKVVTSSTKNSDCKSFAGNEDFLRLRKKMLTEIGNENMIKVAKKYFRNKCFSTEQIKDLSYLFLNDEGKYEFFDAAFAHTSDSDQYQILESQLRDEYYLNRFKAMIHK